MTFSNDAYPKITLHYIKVNWYMIEFFLKFSLKVRTQQWPKTNTNYLSFECFHIVKERKTSKIC